MAMAVPQPVDTFHQVPQGARRGVIPGGDVRGILGVGQAGTTPAGGTLSGGVPRMPPAFNYPDRFTTPAAQPVAFGGGSGTATPGAVPSPWASQGGYGPPGVWQQPLGGMPQRPLALSQLLTSIGNPAAPQPVGFPPLVR